MWLRRLATGRTCPARLHFSTSTKNTQIINAMTQKIADFSASDLEHIRGLPPKSFPYLSPLLLGDPRLRQECTPCYDNRRRRRSNSSSNHHTNNQSDLEAIADQLITTATAHGSLGLAAPQLGFMKRMFVMVKDWREAIKKDTHSREDYDVFVDPCIESLCRASKTIESFERCESIPGFQGLVARPNCINISYIDGSINETHTSTHRKKRVKRVKKSFSQFQATIFQHELDHLDGILFMDRIENLELDVTQDEVIQGLTC
jgi:peptide deformylase